MLLPSHVRLVRVSIFFAFGQGLLALLLTSPAAAGRGIVPELHFDRAAVPTGILYDRVLPLSGLSAHRGESIHPVTAVQWRQMLHELSRASLDEPGWPSIGVVRRSVADARRGNAVPIGLIHVRYQRIRDHAVVPVGNDLEPKVSAEMLEEAEVFAMASLQPITYRGRSVEFLMDEGWIISNSDAPELLELDVDDGRGFTEIRSGLPRVATYGAPGVKTLRLRATFSDGRRLESRSELHVRTLLTPDPDDTLHVTASVSYQGLPGTGDAYVYLADGHTALTNPILVVEGFDLDNSMDWDELYALLNQQDLIETLRSMGYDAVVLNFAEATEPIQRNGLLVAELIEQVASQIAPTAAISVVGASMGGLVSRYALAYLETQGVDPRVRLFVSFDSPQNGANIPIGVQYWLDFFSGESAEAAFLLERLDTPAARQMLIYHHTLPPAEVPGNDPLRDELVLDLATMGEYPDTPRLVAVANGSGAGVDQGFAAGQQIIHYEYSSLLVDITGNVWAVPDSAFQTVFDGEIDLLWPLPDERLAVSVRETKSFDNAPGGSRNSMAQMDSTTAPYGDIVALFPGHCFIPTISALALDTADPFYAIAGNVNLLSATPFDAVYYPVENQDHVTITPQTAGWLIAELGPVTSVAHSPTNLLPRLYPSSPNPLRRSSLIRFELPVPGRARIELFSVDGRHVATAFDERVGAGTHRVWWSGLNDRGQPVTSGTYFYRLVTERGVATERVVVVR